MRGTLKMYRIVLHFDERALAAHTPRLVDWIENMAAAERAANLRK